MLRFQGEQMTCVMCGKTEKSNPTVESNWRCLEVDGEGYYACPAHFPADETASERQFQKAYAKVLRKIIRVRGSL